MASVPQPGGKSGPRGTPSSPKPGPEPKGNAPSTLALTGDDDPDNRVLRVDRAVRCCELAMEQGIALVESAAQELLSLSKGENLALVPGGVVIPGVAGRTAFPKIVRISKSASGVGFIMLMIEATLASMQDAEQRAQYFSALSEITGNIRRGLTGGGVSGHAPTPCSDCMARQALKQKPRQRKRVKTSDGRVHWLRP